MANEYLDKEGLKRLIKLFKNEIGKVKNKEIVSVSISIDENGNVVSPSVEEYLSLSKRFSNGEIAIIASIGDDYGFISGVSYNDNTTPATVSWVMVSSLWHGIEDYNLVEPLIRVYALEYDGEKLLIGMSDHVLGDAGMRHVIVDIIVDPNTGEVTHPDAKRFNNLTGEFLGGGTFLTVRAVIEGTTHLIVVTEVDTYPSGGISCWRGLIPEPVGFTSCVLRYYSDYDKIFLEMAFREAPVRADKDEIYGKNVLEAYMSPTDIKDIMKSGLAYSENAYTPSPDLTWTPDEQSAACETIGAVPKKYAHDNFVAKVTAPPNGAKKLKVYVVKPDGTQDTVDANPTYSGDDIPRYDGAGRLQSFDPSTDYNVVNKKYVGNLPDNLTLTDDEKTKWCDMVGAVPATPSTLKKYVYGMENGAVKVYGVDHANWAEVNNIPVRAANGAIFMPDEAMTNSGSVPMGKQVVNKNYVDGKVGDIETALDELHNYAQSLVSGGEIE